MKTIEIIDGSNSFEITEDMIISVDGFEYPSVRNITRDVAGRVGAMRVNSSFGRRGIGISAVLPYADKYNKRFELLKAMSQNGTMKLIKFTTFDNKYLQFYGEITKLLNPYSSLRKPFMIEIVAPDFRLYSQTLNEFTTEPTVIRGGLDIPADIPFEFGGVTVINDAVNNGNEEVCPVFTIDGPGTSFLVVNQETGESFTIVHTLTVGQSIIVDSYNRTVVREDDTNIIDDFSGDFWCLEPGSNQIGFTVLGFDANTLLTINWRDGYVGI